MRLTLLEQQASDLNVVNAARVSLANFSTSMGKSEEKLVGFLMRNRHGTPFEHGHFRFHVEAPIFVIREWQRHRVGHSYNEMSGRYTELQPLFYDPHEFRQQVGKPGAYVFEPLGGPDAVDRRQASRAVLEQAYDHAWAAYRTLLLNGVAKEQARAVLPLGIYTQMYWTCNPRSLMHFLGLRNAPEAMEEIRVLAGAAEQALEDAMPVTYENFVAGGRVCP